MKKLLVVVSILLLVFATYEQAHWQREFAGHQAFMQSYPLRGLAGTRATPTGLPLEEAEFDNLGGNLNMVAVLFHKDHVDQPPVYAAALGRGLGRSELSPEEIRSIRRFARLEAEALEHARDFAATIAIVEQQGYAEGIGVDPGNLWRYTFRHNAQLTDTDFHFTWVAETFPLAAALRQLIPVYLMTALLLTALFIPRKKRKQEENPDA